MKLRCLMKTWVLVGALLLSGCAVNSASAPETVNGDRAQETASDIGSLELSQRPAVTYQTYALPTSMVHTVTLPVGDEHRLHVAVVEGLAPLVEIAEAAGAIAAINAGFFDPQNGLTTSYVVREGLVVADPQQNDRLMQNPDLQSYLPAILNRSELRIYECAGTVKYDITQHRAAIPPGCSLNAAVGAGPQLLPRMTGYEEGFLADNEAGEVVRDAVGSRSANARSAIGLTADGAVVLAIASQLPNADGPTGMTFQAMADFLQGLGVEKALNLDGGSSTGLYYNGDVHFGRLDEADTPVERPIKSVLWVR